jgi:hypothetical protein
VVQKQGSECTFHNGKSLWKSQGISDGKEHDRCELQEKSMGHRANFVLIRDGQARAYYDNWAALGCVHCVADGPDDAASQASAFEPTDELLDWAFMEGGYLIDFDERLLIVFGLTDDDLGISDFDDADEGEGDDEGAPLKDGGEQDDDLGEEDEGTWDVEVERATALAFLKSVAPRWVGWLMRWDQRGADAFSEHLARRGITSIKTQTPSSEDCITVEWRA